MVSRIEAHSSDPYWSEGLLEALKEKFDNAVSFLRLGSDWRNGRQYRVAIWIWDASKRQEVIDFANGFELEPGNH